MAEADEFAVPSEASGQRLDRWLSSLVDAPTRSQVAAAIAAGLVSVDGVPAKASRKLRGGERVRVLRRTAPAAGAARPQAIALDVLWHDDLVVAINKPAGMVVHPAAGNREDTLVNALLHRFPRATWPGAADRAGIVHRLDRDTSGVILVARDERSHEALARQFRDRTIEKHYLALVRGDVARAGEIDAPIGRHPRDRKRMSTAARRARTATTGYSPLERFGVATLLHVRPRTGRTHQIRVHLAASGWPVVADPVYGVPSARSLADARKRWPRASAALATMSRQALHAWRIAFAHPLSGERIEVEAPLPDDIRGVVSLLREVPER